MTSFCQSKVSSSSSFEKPRHKSSSLFISHIHQSMLSLLILSLIALSTDAFPLETKSCFLRDIPVEKCENSTTTQITSKPASHPSNYMCLLANSLISQLCSQPTLDDIIKSHHIGHESLTLQQEVSNEFSFDKMCTNESIFKTMDIIICLNFCKNSNDKANDDHRKVCMVIKNLLELVKLMEPGSSSSSSTPSHNSKEVSEQDNDKIVSSVQKPNNVTDDANLKVKKSENIKETLKTVSKEDKIVENEKLVAQFPNQDIKISSSDKPISSSSSKSHLEEPNSKDAKDASLKSSDKIEDVKKVENSKEKEIADKLSPSHVQNESNVPPPPLVPFKESDILDGGELGAETTGGKDENKDKNLPDGPLGEGGYEDEPISGEMLAPPQKNPPSIQNSIPQQDKNEESNFAILKNTKNNDHTLDENRGSESEKNPQIYYENEDASSTSPGYFNYFLTFLGLMFFLFLLFHNKKRLIALVIEGKKPRGRARSRSNSGGGTSYRKLENNFD